MAHPYHSVLKGFQIPSEINEDMFADKLLHYLEDSDLDPDLEIDIVREFLGFPLGIMCELLTAQIVEQMRGKNG